jgi:hypothetical protein
MTTGNHSGVLSLEAAGAIWLNASKELSTKLLTVTPALINPILTRLAAADILVVQYADLTKASICTKVATLRKIVDFIGLNKSDGDDGDVDDKLHCAFEVSDNAKVHRQKSSFSKELAYSITPTIVCDVWNNVKNYSSLFGYTIYNNTIC